MSRRLDSLEFNDIVHLAEVGPLARLLADDICTLLNRTLEEGSCERVVDE